MGTGGPKREPGPDPKGGLPSAEELSDSRALALCAPGPRTLLLHALAPLFTASHTHTHTRRLSHTVAPALTCNASQMLLLAAINWPKEENTSREPPLPRDARETPTRLWPGARPPTANSGRETGGSAAQRARVCARRRRMASRGLKPQGKVLGAPSKANPHPRDDAGAQHTSSSG